MQLGVIEERKIAEHSKPPTTSLGGLPTVPFYIEEYPYLIDLLVFENYLSEYLLTRVERVLQIAAKANNHQHF